MKITVKNIVDEYPKLDIPLPKALDKENFSFVKENIDLYNDDDDIKKYIDTFVQKLNAVADKKEAKEEAKPAKKDVKKVAEKAVKEVKAKLKKEQPKTEKKKPTPKKAAPKPKPSGSSRRPASQKPPVNDKIRTIQKSITLIDEENKVIRAYYLLNGKEKSKKQLANMLDKIAQLNYVKNKDTVTHIKQKISSVHDALKDGETAALELANSDIEKYRKIVTDNKLKLSLQIQELRGLQGLGSIEPEKKDMPTPKEGEVISSTSFMGYNFNLMGFDGQWKQLIGDPGKPFKLMIYGRPGSGKSTLIIQLTKYLTNNHKKKVLYVANEEKFGYTFQEKLSRLQAAHPNLFITDEIPQDLSNFDFVVFDSIQSLGLSPEKLKEFCKNYPQTSFLYVFQVNKEGQFRGYQEYEHDVDTVLIAENGIATTGKNRFGASGEVEIW